MATALDLITRAMRLAKVIGKGETLDDDEAQDGLTALNAMLDSWQIERLFVYAMRDESFSWTGGNASRTVGAAGDFATDRPSRVDSSSYFTVGGYDYPLQFVDMDTYASIQSKTQGSTIPQAMAVDYTSSALVTLYCFPTLSTTATFHLRTWRLLQSFSALTDVVALPAGYRRAIEYSLAEEFGPEFGADIPKNVSMIAARARSNIKRINSPMDVMGLEVGYMTRGPVPGNVYADISG